MKLIKANTLKEGNLVVSNKGYIYQVVTNHTEDVLYLVTEDTEDCGMYLSYNNPLDVEVAKNTFNIEM